MNIDWSKAPEGATHCLENEYGVEFFMVRDGVVHSWWERKNRWEETDLHKVEDLVEIATIWNGEGLPPVGAVCEFAAYQGGDPVWKECKVIAHDEGCAVINYKGNYSGHMASHLRPIRTPEQIAAEERKAWISEAGKALYGMCMERRIGMYRPAADELAADLFDAGYRKHVKT